MSLIVNAFLLLPFWARVAISFFILIFIVWQFLGRPILWILSVVPFLLKKGFCLFYLLIEIPIAALHKRFGTFWGNIDNRMSEVGDKVERVIDCWYVVWHFPKKIRIKRSLIVYVLCIVLIVGPSLINVDNNILKIGETLYIRGETFCVKWLGERGMYASTVQNESNQREQVQNEVVEDKMIEEDSLEITLVVSGIKSSLLVRDIPSIENSTVLDRLHNNDSVVWRGQMVFAEADNDHVEPWVKIVTANGVEGWSRLYYLHPEQYDDIEFFVIK